MNQLQSNFKKFNINHDVEQGTLQKIKVEIKTIVFKVSYALLKDHEISIYNSSIISIIQSFQLFVFAFSQTVSPHCYNVIIKN